MAADLYIYAVPDTAENRDLIARIDAHCNADGEFGYEITDEYRAMVEKLFGEHPDYPDRVHISAMTTMHGADPYWFPLPAQNVLRVFGDEMSPRVANRALSATVTAAMNVVDRSHYRKWREGKVQPRKRVKQFFARNEGALVFAEVD